MFLIPPSPRLRRFHVHWLNFLFTGYYSYNRAFWRHLSFLKNSLLKKEWSKGLMRRLWFYELFEAVLLLRLMSVGEIATWVFLGWKGRALSKRGVVDGTSVFMTESVDGKQRKGFYVVSYSDEPCLGMFIISYVPSVLVWKFFVMDGWGGGGGGGGGGSGEIRICTTCCLRDIKALETVKQSSTHQNGCKCLREAITIWRLEGQYLERWMVMELRRFD